MLADIVDYSDLKWSKPSGLSFAGTEAEQKVLTRLV